MPNSKMDEKNMEAYKKLLLKLKDDLSHDLTNISKDNDIENGHSGDVSGHVMHMADVATDMYDKEFSLGLASNERELMLKIDHALKRIEEKNYGQCLTCGKQIPRARLKALPYAENCLKCQEEIENQK